MVTGLADPSANVIFGAVIDDAYDGEVHVTIIATGFTPSFEDNILAGKVTILFVSVRCTPSSGLLHQIASWEGRRGISREGCVPF